MAVVGMLVSAPLASLWNAKMTHGSLRHRSPWSFATANLHDVRLVQAQA